MNEQAWRPDYRYQYGLSGEKACKQKPRSAPPPPPLFFWENLPPGPGTGKKTGCRNPRRRWSTPSAASHAGKIPYAAGARAAQRPGKLPESPSKLHSSPRSPLAHPQISSIRRPPEYDMQSPEIKQSHWHTGICQWRISIPRRKPCCSQA